EEGSVWELGGGLRLAPLPAGHARDRHVPDRRVLESNRPDNRVDREVGDRVPDGLLVLRIAGGLERREADFPYGMRVADRLRPLFARGHLVLGCDLSRGLARDRGPVRKLRRPPDLGGHAVAPRAERRDRAREEERGGHRADIRPIARLPTLIPERRPVAPPRQPP